MTAAELHRKLLFCGYSDLADCLQSSRLNRFLYKEYLYWVTEYQIDVPILTLINEFYYQCVRVRFDNNPGRDLTLRYLEEEEAWLHSRPAAELVFCFVVANFRLRYSLLFHEECFMKIASSLVQKGLLGNTAGEILKDMNSERWRFDREFSTMSCPVEEIPETSTGELKKDSWIKSGFLSIRNLGKGRLEPRQSAWSVFTDNFSHAMVRQYVELYGDAKDRLALLDRIQAACPPEQLPDHNEFFFSLRAEIEARGTEVDNRSLRKVCPANEISERTKRDAELVKIIEYQEECTKQFKPRNEQYKLKLDQVLQELDTLESKHEREMFELQDHYEAKLEAMRDKAQPAGKKKEKELVFPFAEMVAYVKERFSVAAATEFMAMLYGLCSKRGDLDADISKRIEGIIPAIQQRDAKHQHFEMPNVNQVNINPQKVINSATEEDYK